MEILANDWVTVFVPKATTLTSGDLFYLPAKRIMHLDIPLMKARSIVNHTGLGSGEALREIRLGAPAN